MRAAFPLKRAVEAEEVATAAMELIRNEAMTGQTLAQDAGFLLLQVRRPGRWARTSGR
jgi:enoyl-[acyl-carrier-protein] reductase (NADH)